MGKESLAIRISGVSGFNLVNKRRFWTFRSNSVQLFFRTNFAFSLMK
jgi:hypothetical protein